MESMIKKQLCDTDPDGGCALEAEALRFAGGENIRIFDCYDGYRMALIENVKEQEFLAYCRALACDGHTLYADNEINGNLFRTWYTGSGEMLHCYWIRHSGEARIIVAQDANLPIQSTGTADVCTPLLHQLEALNPKKADGGMGYIIRLADGRFLIVDGGYNSSDNVEAIYTFLKENAPEPEHVVIAAWYISHAHIDHGGAFLGFAEAYSSDSTIILESILFNACDTPEQMRYCTSITEQIESVCQDYYRSVPKYKPLTGQIYRFSTAIMEILYTMSDFLPNTIRQESDVAIRGEKNGDYNVESMVCIVDVDGRSGRGGRVCFLADATTEACNEISSRYGEYLKSDFVQVGHHGIAPIPGAENCRRHDATIEIYGYIAADIALWPTSEAKVEERIVLEVNRYLASTVQEIVIAGAGGYTFLINGSEGECK